MPWLVTTRPTATIEVSLPETDSIAERDAAARAALPEGHVLVLLRPSERIAVARQDVTDTVTIPDRDELWTCAPAGWMPITMIEID